MKNHNTQSRGIGEDIIKLRNEGKTYREIQKELTCSKSTINFHCKKHNLTDTGMKLHPLTDNDKQIIKIVAENFSVKDTVTLLGIGRTAIKRNKNKTGKRNKSL